MAKSKKVSIVDVAKHLGLAKSTVSRALSDYPDIAVETKAKVKSVAQKLGYRASASAQAIRSGHSRSVGLVLNMVGGDAYRPFLTELIDGLSTRLSQAGWSITIMTAKDSASLLQAHIDLYAEKKVDGFIMPRTLNEDPRIKLAESVGMPFVLYGRTQSSVDCAWYDIDGCFGFYQVTKHLIDLGHRQIAFLGGKSMYFYADDRYQGYVQAMQEAGLMPTNQQTRICLENATEADGYASMLQLLDTDEHADTLSAVICVTDHVALGAIKAIHSSGLQVGMDISVIGYDGIAEGKYTNPGLSTLAVDVYAAGHTVGDLFLRQMQGEPTQELQLLGQATFVDRGSVRPFS